MDRDRRAVLYGIIGVLVLVLFAVTMLYAYRSQAPGQPVFGVLGVFASVVLSLLPVVLLGTLVLLLARTLVRTRGPDRYEQLARLADLRDRGVVTEDEFLKEKRRILG